MTAVHAPESTAMATVDSNLPDLSKSANLLKFASFWDGKKLDKLTAKEQTFFLATLGQHIGVRAELGEIILYQGKPYITIDGRLRIAHETGLLDGIDVRPATQMEFTNYGCETGDYLWRVYVFKKGSRRPYTGWGHVKANDRNPVAKTHPRELAKKRAKYDGLRTAFPPKENVGPMHAQYIEDAEEVATIHKTGVARLAAGSYDDELPDDVDVVADDVAADSSPVKPEPVKALRNIATDPALVEAAEQLGKIKVDITAAADLFPDDLTDSEIAARDEQERAHRENH